MLGSGERVDGDGVRLALRRVRQGRRRPQVLIAGLVGGEPGVADHRLVGGHHLDGDASFVWVHADHHGRYWLLLHDGPPSNPGLLDGVSGGHFYEQSIPFLSLSRPSAVAGAAQSK